MCVTSHLACGWVHERPDAQPFTPDNFRSNEKLKRDSAQESAVEKAEQDLPKVMTVASASTHAGGGPSHAVHEASDAHKHELSAEEAAEKAKDKAEKAAKAFNAKFGAMLAAPGRALGEVLPIPEIHWPKQGKQSGEYKANSEPLTDEERSGAFIVLGLTAAVLLLTGPKKEKKHQGDHAAGGDKAGHAGKTGSGGVAGDQQWQKASGADIVGHGARKA